MLSRKGTFAEAFLSFLLFSKNTRFVQKKKKAKNTRKKKKTKKDQK